MHDEMAISAYIFERVEKNPMLVTTRFIAVAIGKSLKNTCGKVS